MKDLSGKFVVVIVDCSGSMSADDICRGIDLIKACVSQGLVVPADIEIGWEMKQNIQSLSPDFSEFNLKTAEVPYL
jgi:uncharacterized NAD(P)/FAD-binding protein YdhS